LAHVCAHIDEAQEVIGMRLLLENPSTYVAFAASSMTEIEFLRAVAKKTGCGLLLDVNNVYVSSVNHGFDAAAYIDAFPIEHVGEFHLGGFAEDRDSGNARLLIDDHGCAVSESVWDLYRRVIARSCVVPTLVEWDNDVPAFAAVACQAARARELLAMSPGCAASMAAA
jgi:uncharacterized protein (UPF0276 family)